VSIRYEGASASSTTLSAMSPGSAIGEDELEPGQYALVIGYDEVFYVQGTPDELHRFAERVMRQVERMERHAGEVAGRS
jgi:hypothetical protein